MDVALYSRVLWRFKGVVVAGLLLAILLAVLSTARVELKGGIPSFAYRQNETWTSITNIFVTQPGFPLGRSFYDRVVPLPNGQTVGVYQDPYRFSNYAVLYAGLATSDPVKKIILRDGPLPGAIFASVPTQPSNPSVALPIVQVNGNASTPSSAEETSRRASRGLITYVQREQAATGTPKAQRVRLVILNHPQPAVLVKGRSLTRPVAVFLALIFMTLGLVFVLENLRPRVRALATEEPAVGSPTLARSERRTA
jgi:hypothetical protein